MIDKNQYQKLLILRAQLDYIIFKDFNKNHDMPDGLKPVHAMTMLKINFIGKISMSELSYSLNMEKGSVTTVADKLINSGYITSNRNSEDRRVYLLELTEKGKIFAEDYIIVHMKYIDGLFNNLELIKKTELFDSIESISNTFDDIDTKHKK